MPAQEDLATRVAALEAAEAVRALVVEYCAIADARTDGAELAALFTEDGVLQNAAGEMAGHAAIAAFFAAGFATPLGLSRHLVTNQAIEVTGPDRAEHRAGWLFLHSAPEGSRVMFGSYWDTVVRTSRGWRFARKVHEVVGVVRLLDGWAGDPPTM